MDNNCHRLLGVVPPTSPFPSILYLSHHHRHVSQHNKCFQLYLHVRSQVFCSIYLKYLHHQERMRVFPMSAVLCLMNMHEHAGVLYLKTCLELLHIWIVRHRHFPQQLQIKMGFFYFLETSSLPPSSMFLDLTTTKQRSIEKIHRRYINTKYKVEIKTI